MNADADSNAHDQESASIRAKGGSLLTRVCYEEDKVIFTEGHDGTDAYIVESGRVAVFKTLEGKSVRLAILEKGAMFGEMAAITSEKRSATTIAMEMTTLVRISKTRIQQKISSCDPFVKALLNLLISNLNRVNANYTIKSKEADKLLKDLRDTIDKTT